MNDDMNQDWEAGYEAGKKEEAARYEKTFREIREGLQAGNEHVMDAVERVMRRNMQAELAVVRIEGVIEQALACDCREAGDDCPSYVCPRCTIEKLINVVRGRTQPPGTDADVIAAAKSLLEHGELVAAWRMICSYADRQRRSPKAVARFTRSVLRSTLLADMIDHATGLQRAAVRALCEYRLPRRAGPVDLSHLAPSELES